MVTVDHASPRPRFLLSREPRSSRSCPRSTSFSTLPGTGTADHSHRDAAFAPLSKRSSCVQPGGPGDRLGVGLADTSVSERSRKRA